MGLSLWIWELWDETFYIKTHDMQIAGHHSPALVHIETRWAILIDQLISSQLSNYSFSVIIAVILVHPMWGFDHNLRWTEELWKFLVDLDRYIGNQDPSKLQIFKITRKYRNQRNKSLCLCKTFLLYELINCLAFISYFSKRIVW